MKNHLNRTDFFKIKNNSLIAKRTHHKQTGVNTQRLRLIKLESKMRGHRSQWFSPLMNDLNPGK